MNIPTPTVMINVPVFMFDSSQIERLSRQNNLFDPFNVYQYQKSEFFRTFYSLYLVN
jgi:hypothetical protein